MSWHFYQDKPPALKHIQTPLQVDKTLCMMRRVRSPMHILVVEDDVTTQRLINNVLTADYAVTISATIHDAVNDYLRVMPDLVFLDINLGDRIFSGMDVLYTLRQLDSEANIIMVSSKNDPQYIKQAMCNGAMAFILKPFAKGQLHQYIKYCEKVKARRCN